MTNEDIFHQAVMKCHKVRPDLFSEGLSDGCFIATHNSFEHNCIPIIFSHAFAKAFWGNFPSYGLFYSDSHEEIYNYAKSIKQDMIKDCQIHAWEYNLQQMVLEKEPLKYLEKFL